MKFDQSVIDALKERYIDIHPLIFHRSLEKANTMGDLFDILDSFPKTYPVIWNEKLHCWSYTNDLFLKNNFIL